MNQRRIAGSEVMTNSGLNARMVIFEQQLKQHERDIENLRTTLQQLNGKLDDNTRKLDESTRKLDEVLMQAVKTKWFVMGFFGFWFALEKGLFAALQGALM